MSILEIKNLTIANKNTGQILLDNISFVLDKGSTLGIVGESGSGKTLTGLSILGLLNNSVFDIHQGSIIYNEIDILKLTETEIQKIRTKSISIVFQEPMLSLNPVQKISTQLNEVIKLHIDSDPFQQKTIARDILSKTGLDDAQKILDSYPHMLSGGQRQRIMIAIALVCNPDILIADEPTTALDVTIQAQVLELIRKLRDELSTAILLITHDLGVIAENADRVIVMYAGKKIEEASIAELFNDPLHPYTKGLLKSVPSFDNKLGNENQSQSQTRLEEIPGIVPPLADKPRGCSFAPRCSLSTEKCRESSPSLKQKGQDHTVACWVV